jgi:hypothetical protein
MRIFGSFLIYLLGVMLALVAAATGSIGPEPAKTVAGRVLAAVYLQYFDLFGTLFGGVGIVIALILSGIPFVLAVWLIIWIAERTERS